MLPKVRSYGTKTKSHIDDILLKDMGRPYRTCVLFVTLCYQRCVPTELKQNHI